MVALIAKVEQAKPPCCGAWPRLEPGFEGTIKLDGLDLVQFDGTRAGGLLGLYFSSTIFFQI